MMGAISRITNATSASGSAAGASFGAALPGPDFSEKPLRIEWRDVGGKVGNRQRQIAGDAYEGTNPHDFVVADPIDGRDADHLAGESRFFSCRQTVALVRAFFGAATERATEGNFDAFRERGKVGFAIERRENGAAHESSAAKRGENRTGKPLH